MIKIEKAEIANVDSAIRGMRNPKNSWNKSDSYRCPVGEAPKCATLPQMSAFCENHRTGSCVNGYIIGQNDQKLMMGLANGGPVHAKYRRFITVTVDITAPLYWWKEFKTYKKGRIFLDDEDLPFDGDRVDRSMDAQDYVEPFVDMNSCSTMHKIHEKEFTLDDFAHEHLNSRSLKLLEWIITELNFWRDIYLNGGMVDNYDGTARVYEPKEKDAWWQMIQLLPSSYMQKRTVLLNYEVLHEMYMWRNHHKLDEWLEFCKWIESLPMSCLITGDSITYSSTLI